MARHQRQAADVAPKVKAGAHADIAAAGQLIRMHAAGSSPLRIFVAKDKQAPLRDVRDWATAHVIPIIRLTVEHNVVLWRAPAKRAAKHAATRQMPIRAFVATAIHRQHNYVASLKKENGVPAMTARAGNVVPTPKHVTRTRANVPRSTHKNAKKPAAYRAMGLFPKRLR